MAEPLHIVPQNAGPSHFEAGRTTSPVRHEPTIRLDPGPAAAGEHSQSQTSTSSAVAAYFETALQVIAEQAQSSTAADGAAIALGDSNGMVCRARTGAAPELGVHLRPGAGLSGYCLRTGETVLCSDTQSDSRADALAAHKIGVGSIVILPVFSAGRLVALLQVMSSHPQAFGARETACLEQLARALSATIENSQRLERATAAQAAELRESSSPQLVEPAEPEGAAPQNVAARGVLKDPPATDACPTEPAEPIRDEITATQADTERLRSGVDEELPGFLSRSRRLGYAAGLIVLLSAVLSVSWYVGRKRAIRAELVNIRAELVNKVPFENRIAAPVIEPSAAMTSSPPTVSAARPPEAETPATPTDVANTTAPTTKVTTVPTSRVLLNRAKQMKIDDIAPLERRAKSGDAEAQVTLGLAYAEGTLLRRDAAQAVTWYRRAAERGYVPAQEALALAYQFGNGMPKSGAQAMTWYTRAAEHGSIMAANELGVLYSSGAGVPQNFREAWKWFRVAAEKGDATAQYNLARMYHSAQGVPANPGLEFQWLRKAARQGLPAAQFALALMYQEGVGVRADPAEAVRLLRQAAGQGNRLAQMQLGYVYLKGLGVPVDYQLSVKWYRLAAEQGDPTAAYALSVRYFTGGQGVAQDYNEAGKWTRVAAQNGHPDAQYNLAVMYDQGVGIPVDLAEAAKWYARAADQGIGSAQLRLGAMYADGKGVSKDLVTAYKWTALGQNETAGASDKLRSLRDAMTPEQLRAAERAIADWRAAHPTD